MRILSVACLAGMLFMALGLEAANAFSTRFQPYFDAGQVANAPVGTGKGQLFPDIAFVDPAGERRSIADYRGKIVVINFWGKWCPPCRREMPSLAELYERFEKDGDVQFIFLQIGESAEVSKAYVEREGFVIPVFDSIIAKSRSRRVLLAPGNEVNLRNIGITRYLTTVFVDKNGLVMARVSSNYHWKSWGDSMVDAVQNAPPAFN